VIPSLAYDIDVIQAQFDQMVVQLSTGLSADPVADLFTAIDVGAHLADGRDLLNELKGDQKGPSPQAAVREVLGYSEVTGEPCGADFQTMNEDDNQSNNLAFC
jgi:hypothetical protein